MADLVAELEAMYDRDEREREKLIAFVRQIAFGQHTKHAAIIHAKSLLRELGEPHTRGVDSCGEVKR